MVTDVNMATVKARAPLWGALYNKPSQDSLSRHLRARGGRHEMRFGEGECAVLLIRHDGAVDVDEASRSRFLLDDGSCASPSTKKAFLRALEAFKEEPEPYWLHRLLQRLWRPSPTS